LHFHLNLGNHLEEVNWRPHKPKAVFQVIDGLLRIDGVHRLFDLGNDRSRIERGSDRDRVRPEGLRPRNVDRSDGVAVEPFLTHVADDPDDLDPALGIVAVIADGDSLADGIRSPPVLGGEGPVEDPHGRLPPRRPAR